MSSAIRISVLAIMVACGRVGFDLEARDAGPPETPSAYATVVRRDGPVAYWRLGVQDGMIAVDSMGAHNGIYVNGPTLGVGGALQNDLDTAVRFGGSADNLTVPTAPDLCLNGSWTLEFWAKLGGANPFPSMFPALLSKGDPDRRGTGWLIYIDSNGPAGNLRPTFKRANLDGMQTATELSSMTFGYFVLTYDGTTIAWHVNGTLESSYEQPFPQCTDIGDLLVGAEYNGNDSDMILDEIAIYSAALTGVQIDAHYRAAR